MVSGKYSALAGAISRQQAINNLSNNMANMNTVGFKKSEISFEAILQGKQQIGNDKGINYSRVSQNKVDFSQGPMRPTENPLDLAIEGEGFFKLQGPEGDLYTRRGDFGVRSDGVLTTRHGLPVLGEGGGEIVIPETQISRIAFGSDGTIYTLGNEGRRATVGKLALVDIEDKSFLKNEADTTFSLKEGGQEIESQNAQVLQGNLEGANINMTMMMAQLIDNQRTFETLNKALKNYSEISREQDKLGSLS